MDNGRKPSRRLNLQDAIEIWKMSTEGVFQNRIAALFDANPGRVNEVLKGKKFPDARRLAGL